MKFSMVLVPILAGFGLAGVVRQREESVANVADVTDVTNGADVTDSIEAATDAEVCCNTTPCFIGCPVNGVFVLCC
ncbi:hypothetical protein AnigIFM49718_004339 [Aspergillus niger]|nr:hypothetical protein AnigIFM49718_004339 [Aspergillus niger]